MATISFWVEKIVEGKPFLEDSLSQGIINHAALAEKLIPEIESKLKKKVKFSAVNMAIRRLAEKLDKKYSKKIKFHKDSDITVKSNLVVFMIKRTWVSQRSLKEIYTISDGKPGNFLSVTQGPHEIMITTSDANEEFIENIFNSGFIQKKYNKICGLTIKLPENSIETPGFIYLISKTLFSENIAIVDLISTYTELTLLLNEDDTTHSFEVLRKMVKDNQ